MQTFLPYKDFHETARVLDYRRLGKQRVEAWQLIRAIRGETKGWRNHPAARMWDGYEKALVVYALAICEEWVRRGYKDTLTARFEEELSRMREPLVMPPWLGDERFHRSHQSNLVRKYKEFYQPLFPGVEDDLEYVWPVLTA